MLNKRNILFIFKFLFFENFKIDVKTNSRIVDRKFNIIISNTEKKNESFIANKLLNTNNKKNKDNLNLNKMNLKILNSPSATSNFTDKRKNLFSPCRVSKLLSPSPSLRPFPLVNNEFYNEAKNNVLWEGESQKLKAEKSLNRNNTERKYLRNNMFIFNKVKLFPKHDKNC
jgi:hypothetical protein